MDESECLVCFSQYNDEEHRPRVLPCGHTMCSKCLNRSIREESKMCPKCRIHYSVSNVEELPVNFSLEGMVKSLKILKNTKEDKQIQCADYQNTKVDKQTECSEHQLLVNQKKSEFTKEDKLPECPEHQLPVSLRCSAHKAWICQSCLIEDHSSGSCKIIPISEELNNKKTRQLKLSQPFLDRFEESCKNAEYCKIQCKKIIEEYKEEVIRCESIIAIIKEEIQKKKNASIQMEERLAIYDKKLDNLQVKKGSYDQAVTSLEFSDTIREVSRSSVEVQKEVEKLKLISHDIDNEKDLILQNFKVKNDYMLGYFKLSIRDGRPHFHGIQNNDIFKSLSSNLQDGESKGDEDNEDDTDIGKLFGDYVNDFDDEYTPPLTDGVLTFLDIAWPDQEPRRLYMKMLGNTARAKQHLLLVTGQNGHSYKGLHFSSFARKGVPGESIVISPYDGKSATPLLKDVEVTDTAKHKIKLGLVTAAESNKNNFNNALFSVTLSDYPGYIDDSGFAEVISGLEILQDVAKSDERQNIVIVDCGIVFFW